MSDAPIIAKTKSWTVRILLVEDDDGDALLLQRVLLYERGEELYDEFYFLRARNLAAALREVAKGEIDVILLDLGLPDSQGLDTFVRLRAAAASVPIVVLTGLEDEALAITTVQQGAQDYIVKGKVDSTSLARAIRYAIVRHREQQAQQELNAELERRVHERTAKLEEAVDALRKSEEKYRLLAENATDMISILTADGVCLYASPACRTLLGYAAEELVGRSAYEFTHPDDRAAIRASHAAVLAQKAKGTVTSRMCRKDGTYVWAETTSRAIHDERGGATAEIQAVSRDITERMQAEEQRRIMATKNFQDQKLESLGLLAGGMAHDFNNLLTAILGNAELALMDISLAAPIRESLREINQAAQHAADLCRQILAYSGKGRFIIQALDLRELVTEMKRMLELPISKKAVLRCHFAGDIPPIEADATQIRQVIMNLVVNASEAIGEEGSGVISISIGAMECDRAYLAGTYIPEHAAEGTHVCLEVADTGCGMDEATKARIFDPFFTTKFTGHGLGLAAVLGIVRGHKGTIEVCSEKGKGATFKLLFPVAKRPADRMTGSDDGSGGWKGTGTILLVDDEEPVRKIGKMILERLGFRVIPAAGGREALDIFRRTELEQGEQIACVLLDLTMPHMDGQETFRELRLLRSDVPVILTSGYNEQDVTQKFVGQGIAGFVPKPYQIKELAARLRAALAPGAGRSP